MAGLGDCESLLTYLKTRKMIAEGNLARHVLSTQQGLEAGDLDNAYWLPGADKPAGGLTKMRSGAVPLLRLLESGCPRPGSLRPLKEVAWKDWADHGAH